MTKDILLYRGYTLDHYAVMMLDQSWRAGFRVFLGEKPLIGITVVNDSNEGMLFGSKEQATDRALIVARGYIDQQIDEGKLKIL